MSANTIASVNRIPKLRHGLMCAAVALACSVAAMSSLAQNNGSNSAGHDDIGNFLLDKGLINKIGDQMNAAGKAVSDKASELVINAMGFLGVPYKRGGNTFDQGLDCSGFVRLMYEQTVGLVLPRRSAEQAAATQPIDKSELQPGDLVFFNTLKSAFSHVGIYVGDNKFIHSPRSGGVVRVEDMRVNYWQQRFDGARRVDPNAQAAVKANPPASDAPR
jgi:NlpC/P60 family